MNCPNCNTIQLQIAERQGIEIDYCPTCRGIWLDRGELDKIIDRSIDSDDEYQQRRPSSVPPVAPMPQAPRYDRDDDYYKKKRKKNWLGEMFDF